MNNEKCYARSNQRLTIVCGDERTVNQEPGVALAGGGYPSGRERMA